MNKFWFNISIIVETIYNKSNYFVSIDSFLGLIPMTFRPRLLFSKRIPAVLVAFIFTFGYFFFVFEPGCNFFERVLNLVR